MTSKQPPAQYVKPRHIHDWALETQPVYSTTTDGTVYVQDIRVQTCSCGAIKVQPPSAKRRVDAEVAE